MHINSHSKTTEHSTHSSQNKQTFNLEHNFEENLLKNEENILSVGNSSRIKTLKVQEERCLKAVRSIKRREKMREKVEKYLSKKMEEERKRMKIMMQVLNDISKTFPYMAFYLYTRNKI